MAITATGGHPPDAGRPLLSIAPITGRDGCLNIFIEESRQS
jgi:hypothetical protein